MMMMMHINYDASFIHDPGAADSHITRHTTPHWQFFLHGH